MDIKRLSCFFCVLSSILSALEAELDLANWGVAVALKAITCSMVSGDQPRRAIV